MTSEVIAKPIVAEGGSSFSLSRLAWFGMRSALFPSFICLVILLSLVAYSVACLRSQQHHPFRQLALKGNWIRAAGHPSHAGYFRKRFSLPGTIKHAWIVVAPSGGFEICVNRNPVGRIFLWRPTRPFQSGSSEKGQVVNPSDPAMALNFPREYQWSGHDNWRLPIFIDMTHAFLPGMNVISIESESRGLPASINFYGEIEMGNGEVIPFRSDSSWLGEPRPRGPQLYDWTEPFYWDKEWRDAVICEGPTDVALRTVPEAIYSTAFRGEWLRHPSTGPKTGISFHKTWHLDKPVDEAWFRMIVNRRFELFINGSRVTVLSARTPDLDNGEWIFGRSSATDPIAQPELLDPDEIGNLFVGQAFETPRKADQKLEAFVPIQPMHQMPFRYISTTHRSEPPGVYDPERTLAESRRTPSKPDTFPERPAPNSLKRSQSIGAYFAYSIGPLLHQGDNTIEVRCVGKADALWSSQIAVDGGAILDDGLVESLPSHDGWQAAESNTNGQSSPSTESSMVAATCEGKSAIAGTKLPPMQYRGVAQPSAGISVEWPRALRDVFTIGLCSYASIFLATLLLPLAWKANRRSYSAKNSLWYATAQVLYSMQLVAAVTLATGLLLRSSWSERDENLWFETELGWIWMFYAVAILSVIVGVVDCLGRIGFLRLKDNAHRVTGVLQVLPQTRVWPHLIFWLLMLSTLLRAYKLDLQPLDDDEYASTQAVLAIIDTGTPRFVPDDVYYSRSPLYHYVAAALAYPFGGDLWSLRLQTVGWGVATVWLTYLCGSRLMGSRWVGLISMLLMAIHPLEIFTGHVIRFYQVQQFFALLTMYLFCLGFVTDQKQSYRIATVLIFVAAVLSQEITAAMGVPLVINYIVFSKDLGWRKNFQLIIISATAMSMIVLDFVAFQVLCLTRTEGISPSIEATVSPHFWLPLNMFSVFIGYSRLHVVPSAFFFAGLPLLWKENNRNTLALISFLVSGIVMTNLLVTSISLRYLYWVFPIWMLLSIDCMRLVLTSAIRVVYCPNRNLNRYVVAMGASSTAVVIGCVASFSPWRIPDSYEMSILGDSTGCVRYVRSQMRPGDKIAITEPHTHTAFLEAGKCDFDLAIPLLYDFAVMRDGRLVDRNGGGELMTSVDDMIKQMAKGGRIWVLVNREKFRTRGKNLRWEYPGARFEVFLRKNCELRYRTYLWNAYLWDPAQGHYIQFRNQE